MIAGRGPVTMQLRKQEKRAVSAMTRLSASLDQQEQAMRTLDRAFTAGGQFGSKLEKFGERRA